jgi:hypothetical protein
MSWQFQPGWIDDRDEVAAVMGRQPHGVFCDSAAALKDSGKGQKALPYQAVVSVLGKQLYFDAQTRGTCVAKAAEIVLPIVKCLQILGGKRERFPGLSAHEPIYAGSRVEIGGGKLGAGDGSVVAWAGEWLQKYGDVLRQVYSLGGATIDLTKASDEVACAWGRPRAGVPDALEPIAKEHPVQTISQIANYEEARDALYNKAVLILGCNTLMSLRRDSEGFSVGTSGRGGHATPIIGVDDESKRPGVLIDYRSWPISSSGGTRHDQPDNTMWIDADQFNRMVNQGECIALRDQVGWDPDPIDYVLG